MNSRSTGVERSWVGEHVEVLGKGCARVGVPAPPPPPPPGLALRISSICLSIRILSHTLYNRPVNAFPQFCEPF